MFLLDKIIAAPFYGIYKIFEEVHAAVQQDREKFAEDIKQELMLLYRSLERSEITEDQFEQQERLLLDKLDELTINRR